VFSLALTQNTFHLLLVGGLSILHASFVPCVEEKTAMVGVQLAYQSI
jgi:hypothetical protein